MNVAKLTELAASLEQPQSAVMQQARTDVPAEKAEARKVAEQAAATHPVTKFDGNGKKMKTVKPPKMLSSNHPIEQERKRRDIGGDKTPLVPLPKHEPSGTPSPIPPLDIPKGLRRKHTPESDAKVAEHVKRDRRRREGKDIKNPPTKARQASGRGKGGNGAPAKGTKLALVAGLLRRPQGCTTADVLNACNWPAVSMPAMAKAAGIKLVKEKKKGEVTRYRGA